MRRIDRYVQLIPQVHTVVDSVACSVVQEYRPALRVNWRNIKNDVCQGLRNVWGWVKDVVAIDELMEVLA